MRLIAFPLIFTDNMGASEPCVDQDHLLQTRVCNRKPCLKPLWQIGAWSECAVAMGDGRICGNNTGVQSRDVYCAVQPGKTVRNKTKNPTDQCT